MVFDVVTTSPDPTNSLQFYGRRNIVYSVLISYFFIFIQELYLPAVGLLTGFIFQIISFCALGTVIEIAV